MKNPFGDNTFNYTWVVKKSLLFSCVLETLILPGFTVNRRFTGVGDQVDNYIIMWKHEVNEEVPLKHTPFHELFWPEGCMCSSLFLQVHVLMCTTIWYGFAAATMLISSTIQVTRHHTTFTSSWASVSLFYQHQELTQVTSLSPYSYQKSANIYI